MRRDSFGDRMKAYEAAAEHVLPARLPVLLRLDGNSFSKLTAGLQKPFDERFERAMDAAAVETFGYVQAVLGYVQSDEITLLLRNDRSPGDSPFLGNRVQKLCSLAAATCSVAFAAHFGQGRPAFDCRVFVVPPSEVANAFLWRQRDAFKNCVGAVAHHALLARDGSAAAATRRLAGLSTAERQELLFAEFGINVNDLPVARRRGRCIRHRTTREPIEAVVPGGTLAALVASGRIAPGSTVERRRIAVDDDVPEFHRDRAYIEDLLG
jgi:tRNA(His) 5'-end guanylyltransferase